MKYLMLFFLLILSLSSRADAWDNLTNIEAEAVIVYLYNNPYIFEYCDCCDDENDDIFIVELVYTYNARIVPCSWDANYYSIEYDFDVLAEITYKDDGSSHVMNIPAEPEDPTHTIYMNYTWGLNADTGKASPMFDIVTYQYSLDHPHRCKDLFNYPTPAEMNEVGKFKAYNQWYKNYVK